MVSRRQSLIIFDLDGTLVDSFHTIQIALNAGLANHNFPGHDIHAVKKMVGNGMRRLVERALPLDSPDETVETVLASVKEEYAKAPEDSTKPYDGAAELLMKLKEVGYCCVVLTNKPHHLALKTMKSTGLDLLVDQTVGPVEGQPVKPDSSLLNHFCSSPDEYESILMVGDGIADAEFARNAGIRYIGVSWGNHRKDQLEPFGPVAETFQELEELISGSE